MPERQAIPVQAAWSEHIDRIAKGRDKAAFAELFGHFAPRLKSYFMRVGGPDLAEELAQEAMLTVWRKADSFDAARASAATWIFTIARNLRVDRLRRERDPSRLASFHDGDAVATPGDILNSAERESRTRQALANLPQEQLEVVRLSFFEERSHAEISKTLNIPLGTVKSRVRLAMARLRTLVEDLQ